MSDPIKDIQTNIEESSKQLRLAIRAANFRPELGEKERLYAYVDKVLELFPPRRFDKEGVTVANSRLNTRQLFEMIEEKLDQLHGYEAGGMEYSKAANAQRNEAMTLVNKLKLRMDVAKNCANNEMRSLIAKELTQNAAPTPQAETSLRAAMTYLNLCEPQVGESKGPLTEEDFKLLEKSIATLSSNQQSQISDYWRNRLPEMKANLSDSTAAIYGKQFVEERNGAQIIYVSFTDSRMAEKFNDTNDTYLDTRNPKNLNASDEREVRGILEKVRAYSNLRIVYVDQFDATMAYRVRVGSAEIGEKGVAAFGQFPNPSEISYMMFDRKSSLNTPYRLADMHHEIGHAIGGFQHPFGFYNEKNHVLKRDVDSAPNTAMTYRKDARATEFGMFDIEGFQTIYGKNNEHNSGNTLYTLRADDIPSQLIIDDGGGENIISAARFRPDAKGMGVHIDISGAAVPMSEGHIPDVRVSRSSKIHRVIGSMGADRIVSGNEQDVLRGGEGIDQFLIGHRGMHAIQDFSKEDYLSLPDFSHWGATVVNGKDVILAGRNAATQESVKVLVHLVDQKPEEFLSSLKTLYGHPLEYEMHKPNHSTELKDAIKLLSTLMQQPSVTITEESILENKSSTVLHAAPLPSPASTRWPR